MVIAGLLNQKGGVGKTTTAVNLASGLAMRGHKTLLVDMDPQYNASKLTRMDEHKYYIGEALIEHDLSTGERSFVPMNQIICKIKDKLDIAPGTTRLSADGELLDKEVFSEQRLLKALEGLDYEYVVIDSPPNLGRLTINVIYASDILLIPVRAGFLSIDAYRSMTDLILKIKGSLKPKNIKIFYTLYKKGSKIVNEWATEDLEDSQDFIMDTYIRELTVHEQAQIAKESIFEFAPQSKGAKDYNKFIEEFLSNGRH